MSMMNNPNQGVRGGTPPPLSPITPPPQAQNPTGHSLGTHPTQTLNTNQTQTITTKILDPLPEELRIRSKSEEPKEWLVKLPGWAGFSLGTAGMIAELVMTSGGTIKNFLSPPWFEAFAGTMLMAFGAAALANRYKFWFELQTDKRSEAGVSRSTNVERWVEFHSTAEFLKGILHERQHGGRGSRLFGTSLAMFPWNRNRTNSLIQITNTAIDLANRWHVAAELDERTELRKLEAGHIARIQSEVQVTLLDELEVLKNGITRVGYQPSAADFPLIWTEISSISLQPNGATIETFDRNKALRFLGPLRVNKRNLDRATEKAIEIAKTLQGELTKKKINEQLDQTITPALVDAIKNKLPTIWGQISKVLPNGDREFSNSMWRQYSQKYGDSLSSDQQRTTEAVNLSNLLTETKEFAGQPLGADLFRSQHFGIFLGSTVFAYTPTAIYGAWYVWNFW